jgi:DNA adenine methylase
VSISPEPPEAGEQTDLFGQPANGNLPEPFLKWAGGKRQLLPELMRRVDRVKDFGRYHEPFVGGGALFFELWRQGKLRKPAYLSDTNPNLMVAYEGVRDATERVIGLLHMHKRRHENDYYYSMRASKPEALASRAARIIYLNRTCFNGLFRENSKGEFNVPIGRYKNPKICDAGNLRAVAEALRDAVLETRPFETVVEKAKPGDFVYFDPPYHPVSKTANFTAYQRGGFGEAEQRALAEVVCALDAKGVYVLLSNSWTPFIRELYADFTLDKVSARRHVNSRADKRGPVSEALVRNF